VVIFVRHNGIHQNNKKQALTVSQNQVFLGYSGVRLGGGIWTRQSMKTTAKYDDFPYTTAMSDSMWK